MPHTTLAASKDQLPGNNIYITENSSYYDNKNKSNNSTNRIYSKGILSLKLEEEKLLQNRLESGTKNRGL
jgi:hypothetical protein